MPTGNYNDGHVGHYVRKKERKDHTVKGPEPRRLPHQPARKHERDRGDALHDLGQEKGPHLTRREEKGPN